MEENKRKEADFFVIRSAEKAWRASSVHLQLKLKLSQFKFTPQSWIFHLRRRSRLYLSGCRSCIRDCIQTGWRNQTERKTRQEHCCRQEQDYAEDETRAP